MFIRNDKRFNIYASQEIDGVTYPSFTDPVLREKLGITEIPDPVPPEDYSDETYYRTEQDDYPYIVYTRKSDEQIAEQELSEARAKATEYLRSTDWYVTRLAETGKAIPEEVLASRAEARLVL